MPLQREQIVKRWQMLMLILVGNDVAAYAVLLGRSPAGVRDWVSGKGGPHNSELNDLLLKLRLPPEIFHSEDEVVWQRLLERLRSRPVPPPPVGYQPWLFSTRDIMLNALSPARLDQNASVIFIATSHEDHMQRSEIRDQIRDCASKGVAALYVIPTDYIDKEDLITFAFGVSGMSPAGSVSVLETRQISRDLLWVSIESVILITKPNFTLSRKALATIGIDHVDQAFEQLYTGNDSIPPDGIRPTSGGRLWSGTPYRRLSFFTRLLNEWAAADAQWHHVRIVTC